jgi:hypothetical protein
MIGPPNPMSTTIELIHDPETSDFVLAITDADTGRRIATLCVPADAMEQAVLRHIPVALELRPDGTVVAFVDRGDTADLASKTLVDLIAEAVSVVSPEDDAEDLATLEQMLETSLAAVRQKRQRLASQSGR